MYYNNTVQCNYEEVTVGVFLVSFLYQRCNRSVSSLCQLASSGHVIVDTFLEIADIAQFCSN